MSPVASRIVAAAHAQIGITLVYDPSYVRLDYPGGDVPPERGVCADVVIRALRAIGLDLQRAVHEDMRAHFGAYPRRWGLARPAGGHSPRHHDRLHQVRRRRVDGR